MRRALYLAPPYLAPPYLAPRSASIPRLTGGLTRGRQADKDASGGSGDRKKEAGDAKKDEGRDERNSRGDDERSYTIAIFTHLVIRAEIRWR